MVSCTTQIANSRSEKSAGMCGQVYGLTKVSNITVRSKGSEFSTKSIPRTGPVDIVMPPITQFRGYSQRNLGQVARGLSSGTDTPIFLLFFGGPHHHYRKLLHQYR